MNHKKLKFYLLLFIGILAFQLHSFRLPGFAKILTMNYVELVDDFSAQQLIFKEASAARDKMGQICIYFVDIADCNVNLKGDTWQELFKRIADKSHRKKSKMIGQIPDMARGRISLDFKEEIELATETLCMLAKNQGFEVLEIIKPRREVLIGDQVSYGYSRTHVILKDKNGLLFEWQIGTKSVNDVFEKLGIPIVGLEWPQHLKNNLHDIAYVAFNRIKNKAETDEEYHELIETINLKEYGQRLDYLAAKAHLLGAGYKNLLPAIWFLHMEAGNILLKIIRLKGQKFLFEQF